MQIGTRIPATITETDYDPSKTSPFLELQPCTDASTLTWGDVTDALLTRLLPPRELVSVEECSEPACNVESCFVTTLLVSVERCSHCVSRGTSPDGG